MNPILFDPKCPPEDVPNQGWEWAYIAAFAREGVANLVSNVKTQWLCLASQGRLLPVTVNNGEVGGSYVCLPHSAYILYSLRELDLVKAGPLRPLLKGVIYAFDWPLLASGINRIVHIDNWLLSTNLHGDWGGEDIPVIRQMMIQHYPKHILAIRSLDEWSSPALMSQIKADGWLMLPSRQIWVTQDMAKNWKRRNATQNDRRLLAASSLVLEEISIMNDVDATRIAHLYFLLYSAKYSELNPSFTPEFIRMTCVSGTLRYRVARDLHGQIMAVSGVLVRDGILTPPVVGYDTTRPQSEGLYRVACWLFSEPCATAGLRLHGSAGAADFKRLRGARGFIEYTAMYVGHLPFWRRAVVHLLAKLLEGLAVPIMRKYGL